MRVVQLGLPFGSVKIHGKALDPTQVVAVAEAMEREAWMCLASARAAPPVQLGETIQDRNWWFGRASGFFDAIMILDGSYPGSDTSLGEKWLVQHRPADKLRPEGYTADGLKIWGRARGGRYLFVGPDPEHIVMVKA